MHLLLDQRLHLLQTIRTATNSPRDARAHPERVGDAGLTVEGAAAALVADGDNGGRLRLGTGLDEINVLLADVEPAQGGGFVADLAGCGAVQARDGHVGALRTPGGRRFVARSGGGHDIGDVSCTWDVCRTRTNGGVIGT